MKSSSIEKPASGRPKNKPRAKGNAGLAGWGRLSKRQRARIYRIFTAVFLVIFVISVVGALLIAGARTPTGH